MGNCAVSPDENGEGTKLTFDHQCWLMDYADVLAPMNRKCSYKNFHALHSETDMGVHDIIAGFTKRKSLEKIIRLKPADHGLLQPKVRLWRVHPKTEGEPASGAESEFIFDSFLDPSRISDIFQAQGGLARMGGVGLKKFEWEFTGTNPAEADKIIGVKMTLHFQTMNDLTARWDASKGDGYGGTAAGEKPSFMELILLPPEKHGTTTGACKRPKKNGYNPDYYTIKAQVGWATPMSAQELDPVLVRELEATTLSMYLSLITHEIKINDDGSIDVDVEYVGAMEAALGSKDADVLFPSSWHGAGEGAVVSEGFMGFGSDDRNINDIDAEVEAMENALASNEDSTECAAGNQDELDELAEERAEMEESLDELREMQKELNAENRTQAYEAFTQAISGKIRHLDLDNGFLEHWQENENNKRPSLTGDDSGGVVTITIGDQGWFDDPASAAEEADETDVSDDDIYFVFFGDIVDTACLAFSPENVRSPKSPVKNMKILLGPMTYINMRDPVNDDGTPNQQMINLADLPISYTMFLKFWNDRVIEPERDSYSVRAFIKDCLQTLIAPALTPGCFPNGPSQNTSVAKAAFTVASPGGAKDVVDECPKMTGGRVAMTDIQRKLRGTGSSPTASGDEEGWQYVLFYMNTAALGNGDRMQDERRGIYHYAIGEDRGLIKKIEFKKNDIQGMKEARQDSSGALSQLREMYNADVKMIGNNIYIPGMTLFLWPPPGLGNPSKKGSAANMLGIGGYFNVIKVRSVISRGGAYSTDLECVFIAASKDPPPDEGSGVTCPAEHVPPPVSEGSPWSFGDMFERDYDGGDDLDFGDDSGDGADEVACDGEPTPTPWFDW